MKVKHLILTGAVLLTTALAADAQWIGRGGWGGRSGFNVFPGGASYGLGSGISIGVGNPYGGYYGGGFYGSNYGYSPYYGNNFYNRSFYGNTPYYYGTPAFNSLNRSYVTPSYYYGTPTYSYSTPSYSYSQPTYSYSQPTYGYSQSAYQSAPTTYYTSPATTTQGGVVQAGFSPAAGGEWGLKITELPEGNAKKAGLDTGDVIMKVDDKRVQTFEELRSVLKDTSKKRVNVEFIDASNGTLQNRTVDVENTKIGVTVEETPVAKR